MNNRWRDKNAKKVQSSIFKQKIVKSSDKKKRCASCKHFDFTLEDLKLSGKGQCKRFPMFPVQIGNRHKMTYDFVFSQCHKNDLCGQYEPKLKNEQQVKR